MAPAPIFPVKVGQIDDVQELRNAKTKLPERFVRDIPDPTLPTSADDASLNQIPIIDFSKLSSMEDTDQLSNELLRLSGACEEWGFFQVINHGIDLNLLEKMMDVTEEFFMLPLEEKQKYPMAPGTIQGYGQAFVFSEEQKLDWCNMFALGLVPQFIRNPKLWPTKPEHFCGVLEDYSAEIRKLCQSLVKCIAMSLGLKENVFDEMFGVAVQAVRMNYYPPCPRPELVFGLSAHSDGSAITVLRERKGSPVGLQILKDNKWLPVQPIPNALVINMGDTIEVLTNGKYKSVEHRAVANKEKDRLSIATFYAPDYAVELGPMAEFMDEKNPSKYRRYSHGEYSRHYVTSRLEGKKTLDFAKIQPNNNNNNNNP